MAKKECKHPMSHHHNGMWCPECGAIKLRNFKQRTYQWLLPKLSVFTGVKTKQGPKTKKKKNES